MNLTDKIRITNEDNMELMARYPYNYFELAIVDPPYGIGESSNDNKSRSKLGKSKDYGSKIGIIQHLMKNILLNSKEFVKM